MLEKEEEQGLDASHLSDLHIGHVDVRMNGWPEYTETAMLQPTPHPKGPTSSKLRFIIKDDPTPTNNPHSELHPWVKAILQL